ncbi:hypothetical protein KC866_03890 [Patescibacteria group bacterium]|nr:hypothetical protein [Patescibacteria group bacterium]
MDRILFTERMLCNIGLQILPHIKDEDFYSFREKFQEKHLHHFVVNDINSLSGQEKQREVVKLSTELDLFQKALLSRLKMHYGEVLRSEISNSHRSALNTILCHKKVDLYRGEKRIYFSRFYYSMDIQNAFGCMTTEKVLEVLKGDFQDESLEKILKLTCFDLHRGIITGASASSYLYFLYWQKKIDSKIYELCREEGIICTRYVDDFLFSSEHKITKSFSKKVLKVIRNANFEINFQKTQFYDLGRETFNVNGIVFRKKDNRGAIGIPKTRSRKLLGMLNQYEKGNIKIAQLAGAMSLLEKISQVHNGAFLSRTHQKILSRYRKLKR